MRRYPLSNPHPPRGVDPRVVDRLVAERDALANQLQQARETFATLRRRLQLREEENTQLRYALESRQPAGDARALKQELARLRTALEGAESEAERAQRDAGQARSTHERLEQQRDEARAERDRIRAELEARLADVEARAQQAAARVPADAGTDRARRLAADLANLRRRRQEDIDTAVNRTRVRLLGQLADVRDSLDRAVQAAPDADDPWAHGLRGVLAQIDQHLRTDGVQLIGRVGEVFDPKLHEAIATGQHPEGRRNAILEVVHPGLWVAADDLLIRPARVVVSA